MSEAVSGIYEVPGYRRGVRMTAAGFVSAPGDRARTYIIQGSRTFHVKIGVSVNVEARLQALQRTSPDALRLVAVLNGGFALEREFHEILAHDRLHHEWFKPSGELRSMISYHGGAFPFISRLMVPKQFKRPHVILPWAAMRNSWAPPGPLP